VLFCLARHYAETGNRRRDEARQRRPRRAHRTMTVEAIATWKVEAHAQPVAHAAHRCPRRRLTRLQRGHQLAVDIPLAAI